MGAIEPYDDVVRVSFEAAEVWLLMSMTTQLLALLDSAEEAAGSARIDAELEQLTAISFDPIEAPDDPILARLLPDAYRDDQEAADEFRRLTEADLRSAKSHGLGRIVADLVGDSSGGDVTFDLDEEGAVLWLTALTDLRLALGTRIGATEDVRSELDDLPVDSRRYAEIATYDWLSWLQDAMVRALQGD